jgi:signal transduction histidine kinase
MALLRSLSGRLLLVTIFFVMLAEVFIFVPSVARFRLDYLTERLERAQLASLALLATPNDMVDPELEAELLSNAEVFNIALKRDEIRELVLTSQLPGPVAESYDLRDAMIYDLIVDALVCMAAGENRIIRVVGYPSKQAGMVIEVTLDEAMLKTAMREFGIRVFLLSLFISAMTAVMVFFAVRRFVVRPILRVIDSMIAFRENPEDASRVIRPMSRVGELATAEKELAAMQSDIRAALTQQSRLAALGLAVAKISHDLRNSLASAQLLADRLERSSDPLVARTGPKLISSLDRAITLCRRTLDYGKAEEAPPERRRILLHGLVEDVGAMVAPEETGPVAFHNEVEDGMQVDADPDQVFRILANLARNAAQAIESSGKGGEVRIAAMTCQTGVAIEVKDDGPGLPPKARENLFQAFKGGASRQGVGLGLVIAQELARGHGGTLELASSTEQGVTFRLILPDNPNGG